VGVAEKKTAVYGCSYDKREILESRLDGVRPEGKRACYSFSVRAERYLLCSFSSFCFFHSSCIVSRFAMNWG